MWFSYLCRCTLYLLYIHSRLLMVANTTIFLILMHIHMYVHMHTCTPCMLYIHTMCRHGNACCTCIYMYILYTSTSSVCQGVRISGGRGGREGRRHSVRRVVQFQHHILQLSQHTQTHRHTHIMLQYILP